jgi:hypothetical protein
MNTMWRDEIEDAWFDALTKGLGQRVGRRRGVVQAAVVGLTGVMGVVSAGAETTAKGNNLRLPNCRCDFCSKNEDCPHDNDVCCPLHTGVCSRGHC